MRKFRWWRHGQGWCNRSDTSIKFLTLLWQLICSGFLSSFNSDTLKSTYWSCWFVSWCESLFRYRIHPWIYCVWFRGGIKIGWFLCYFSWVYGIWGGFGVYVKVGLVWTLYYAHCLILDLKLLFLLDSLLLIYFI